MVARRRARAAAVFCDHDFLHRRAMDDIVDRLETVKRDFPQAAFNGSGAFIDALTPAAGVGDILLTDSASARLPAGARRVVAHEEALPLAPASLDLFVSLLTLHTANDLVGALSQIKRALKPDGLLIAAVFGEETLTSLRRAFYEAETEITGGVSARVAPFAGIQDFGQALARAGLAMPVVDIDKVSVRYEQPLNLLRDLRGMGETRALTTTPAPLRRDVLMRAMSLFVENGGEEQFQIVYLTGWAPHASQPKPLKPGAARTSLEQAVKGKP